MTLTPKELTRREDVILDGLEHSPTDKTFLGKLYRDGVPTPRSYLKQSVPVLFVFREPNMRGVPYAEDMRDAVRDVRFRPLHNGKREDRSNRDFWNNKVGLFAHAVASALAADPESESYKRFQAVVDRGDWNHEVVNRFAYIQIKKIGGRGSINTGEICEYAAKYGETLKRQISLYRPLMIIGCGVGKASPAQLLAAHVLRGGFETTTSKSGATWWRFQNTSLPRAMIQLYHPSIRGSRSNLYRDVWISVREVASEIGVGAST